MTTSVLEDRRTVWVIAAVSFLLFLIANLPWQLDDSDQAKQAFTSFEMIKEGRWFYQQTPHDHVATKPPLIGWISSGVFALTRSWDMAWRLPSFLAAIGWFVFLLWVIGGILFQPGFFDEVIVREFVARFGETIHRPQPFYFYLPHLLHKFAPWSALMIVFAIVDLHSRNWRLRSVFREMSPETFWLLCWTAGGLVAMSLIPSKRVDRVFPVIPPLCLLLAAQVGKCPACSHGSVSRSSANNLDLTRLRRVATKNEAARTRIYRWSSVALILSILVIGGYTIFKVIS